MNSKSSHIIWLLLGFLVMAAATYFYLTEFNPYCVNDLFPETFGAKSKLSAEELPVQQAAFWKDAALILGSLLLTALCFYFAGRSLGRFFGGSSSSVKSSDLEAELAECRKEYDALLVKTSGGKIEKSENSSSNAILPDVVHTKSNFVADTKPSVSSIDEQIAKKKEELKSSAAVTNTTKKTEAKKTVAKKTTPKAKPAAKKPTAKAAVAFDSKKAKEQFGKAVKIDDLKLVEGVGPKIAGMLNEMGINTWADLAEAKPKEISDFLIQTGGANYKIHNPKTWPKQAKLAADGKFKQLATLQDKLKGGRES